MNLVELFCDVDDFCQRFLPVWQHQLIESNQRKRHYSSQLSDSEIMTIVIDDPHVALMYNEPRLDRCQRALQGIPTYFCLRFQN